MSGSTQSKLLLATLQDFGARIDTVYSLTNKGVHDDVAQAEVDTCVMQTYLLAGEVLRIFEDSSKAIPPSKPRQSSGRGRYSRGSPVESGERAFVKSTETATGCVRLTETAFGSTETEQ